MALYSLVKATPKLIPELEALELEALSAHASVKQMGSILEFDLNAPNTNSGEGAKATALRWSQECFHYGYLGELQSEPTEEGLRNLVAITIILRVYESLFLSRDSTYGGQLEKVLFLAYTRNKIDRGNKIAHQNYSALADYFNDNSPDHIDFYEMAILANMSEMAVRNATRSKAQDCLGTVKHAGRIVVELGTATEWLADRNGYSPVKPEVENQNFVMVPFASDGTFFPQNCERNGHYRIGAKGNETPVRDKYEALKKLQNMKKARWRRPNSNGIPGIVTARQWKPIARKDFESH